MINNKYIIVNLNDIHLQHILECVVETIESAGTPINNKIVVKLPYDNELVPECCSHLQIFNHQEIITELQKPEWQNEEL